MSDFLTTADMSAEVERVIKRSQHRVVIVSPHLRTRYRIRQAARWCVVFGVLSILGGFANDSAWLAGVLLLASAAVLKALADILDELRVRTAGESGRRS